MGLMVPLPDRWASYTFFQGEDVRPLVGVSDQPIINLVRVGALRRDAEAVAQHFVIGHGGDLGADRMIGVQPSKQENVSVGSSGDQRVKEVLTELEHPKSVLRVSEGLAGQGAALLVAQRLAAPNFKS